MGVIAAASFLMGIPLCVCVCVCVCARASVVCIHRKFSCGYPSVFVFQEHAFINSMLFMSIPAHAVSNLPPNQYEHAVVAGLIAPEVSNLERSCEHIL